MMLRRTLALMALLPQLAWADTEVRGRVFYPTDAHDPAYFFRATISAPGTSQRLTTSYTDPAGKVLAEEVVDLNGNRLAHYAYKQFQVNEYGEAIPQEDHLLYAFTNESGRKTDSDKIVDNFFLAPMIFPWLDKHWDELMNGDSVYVRYLSIERLDTIGFKFFRDGERTLRGQPVVDIVLKPSSIFISALVSPIRISVSKDAPHWVVESNGRLPIRASRKPNPVKREDWKAIDARVEYDPPRELAAPKPATKAAPKAKARHKKKAKS